MQPFDDWFNQVHEIMIDQIGIGVEDFTPDQDYMGLWEDGFTPIDAVKEIFEEEGLEFEDDGS